MDSERFDRLTKAISALISRRAVVRGAAAAGLGAAVGLGSILPGADDAEAKKKKKRRKKTICHCATNDPASCSTIRVKKRARKQHLKHHCDYNGPCQPGVVGQCTRPVAPITGCTQDSDCSGATPYCRNRVCVACPRECGGDTPVCHEGRCVACVSDGDCCSPQVCNARNQCVIECGSGACDPDTQKCCGDVCIAYDRCCTVGVLDRCPATTNAANKAAGNRPYVNQLSAGPGEVRIEFVQPHTSLAEFEYVIDGERRTCGEPHPIVTGDFVNPSVCIDNRNNPNAPLPGCEKVPSIVRTFEAQSHVDVRLALGGERDWDFESTGSGWIRFNVTT